MSNLELALVGFTAVVAAGLLVACAGLHLRRVRVAQRITTRYNAATRVRAAYAEHSHTPGNCSFGTNCALITRDNNRRTAP